MFRKAFSCSILVLLLCVTLPGCGSPQEKAEAKRVAIFNELADRLTRIKSDADLTAAKPDLEALGTKIKTMEAENKQLPAPTADEQTSLDAKFKTDKENAANRVKNELERLAKDVSMMAPIVVLSDLKLEPADFTR